ncbi:hypothetical protein FRB96_001800 [Tulasnella sp. 330]|nr:hypothetical protein FRB96_001800 [Tulasnella sp. 330]
MQSDAGNSNEMTVLGKTSKDPSEFSRQTSNNDGDALPKGALDPVYAAKAEVLNRAIQNIGFGHYQRWLFVVTGFGWLVDNLWPVVISIILTPVITEFHFQGPYFELSQNIGLFVGAIVFGLGSDIWGRKVSFNSTLLVVGVFATAAAGSPDSIFLCVFSAFWSVGVGGNLPVDSAIFLEFLPGTHQYLLTVLSIWWAFGQLFASLIAWAVLPNLSCPVDVTDCPKSQNMGWRYYVIIMGVLMIILWAIRFFVFTLYESPKYLMGRGRDAEAVEVVHKVAALNGTTSNLTLRDLSRFDKAGPGVDISTQAAIERNVAKFNASHVRALFKTRTIAWSTTLVISIWGIPGAILAGWMVDLPKFGRKGALASSTLLTGVFLFASTTARSSNQLLGWNCAFTFTSNVMYGVLYAMTPELFPTKDRGTGNGLAATGNRIFGVFAPIVALKSNLESSSPIWISGALFIVAGFLALLLPLETRGKSAM